MNYKQKISLLPLLSAIPLVTYSQEANTDNKMNVVFLLIDDIRWNSIHCMGADEVMTPNIDKIASEGVIFSNAYVTTSISCVSRASILSGQYMSRHNIRDFAINFDKEHFKDTYPARFREAGYWTGMVGKYGVGEPRRAEFDFLTNYSGKHWFPTDKKVKIEQLGNGYTRIKGDSIHVTERNVRDALKFLNERPTDKPFNLSVSFFATHAEDKHPEQYRYQPKSEDLYKNVEIPVSEKADDKYLKGLPEFIQSPKNEGRVRWHWRFDTPEKYQSMMKAYYRMLTEVDEAIGRIVEKLKSDGVYDNTMIVLMGDNGYFHSEYQLADKWYPYNEGVRVPMIIRDPRMDKKHINSKIEDIALNIDIAPTILSAAGIEVPEVMQGENLSRLYIGNDKKNWRKDFFYEHPIISNKERIPSSQGVISAKQKYILWPDYGVEEYYDLRKDQKEVNNVIDKPSYKKTIDKAKARFEELREKAK